MRNGRSATTSAAPELLEMANRLGTFSRTDLEGIFPYYKALFTQCDRGGLTLHFVDFDLVCSPVCPTLLGQKQIGQRWHGKWETWRNSRMDVNKI